MKEQLLKAKIPCEETGIEIRHSLCDICTPGMQCGLDLYVKDDKILKIEGRKEFPGNRGKLCVKGAAGREYQYNRARILQPLKRVGERGSGKFEPISWDEALDICAEQFLKIKAQYGPEAVVWNCGYTKWFRPWLHRLTHAFGSRNYVTESSSCHCAEVMSYHCVFGSYMQAQIPAAKVVILWGVNPLVNKIPMAKGLMKFKENGGKLVVIDPRLTQTAEKLSDIHLRPRNGTDGFMANAMANYLIEKGAVDQAFLNRYVHGFDAYKEMVKGYSLELAEKKTGIPKEKIREVADLFVSAPNTLILPGNGLTHRVDGFNLHRAVLSLMVITGKVDRPGTFKPVQETFCHGPGGFPGREAAFINDVKPEDCLPPIGKGRFPLWFEYINEAQGMDLVRQLRSGDPYPLKALAAFGVNHKMYPESDAFLESLNEFEFIMATDIFHTGVCNMADIILPAKTFFEKGEARCFADRFVVWSKPAVPPLGDCRDDVEIITELAKRMQIDDDLLKAGYDAGVRYMLEDSGITDWEALKESEIPMEAPNAKPYVPGSYLASEKHTISGKIELYSETIAKYPDYGLNPLPVCADREDADSSDYPFTLMTGARISNAIHSRTAGMSWLRAQSKDPALKINPKDAERLQIEDGERVRVITEAGQISLPVLLTEEYAEGEVGMYHGFDEANANSILPETMLDPYSGFPAFKQFRCRIEKGEEA